MQKKKIRKISTYIAATLALLCLVTGCTPKETVLPTETPGKTVTVTPAAATPTPEPTPAKEQPVESEAPSRTYTPLIQPTPTPEPTPTPTPVPIGTKLPYEQEDYYIYTLDRGNGLYAFAWTEECPVESYEINYGTNSSEVTAIQKRLTELGFYCGGANGSFNKNTMTAINEFQAVAGLEKTSNLINRETIDELFSPDGIKNMTWDELEITEGSLDGMTVFLDAGHGEGDTGTARGALVEKTVVIDITYRVKEMLEKAGARVILTRTTDSIVALAYRGATANYVMLDDIVKEYDEKIEAQQNIADNIEKMLTMSDEELSERLKNVISRSKEYIEQYREINKILLSSEEGSKEYISAKQNEEKTVAELKALYSEKEFITKAFYCKLMNVSPEVFLQNYRDTLQELTEQRDEIVHYRDLFITNFDNPKTEQIGMYKRIYNTPDIRQIQPELKEIFDITGEKCTENYAFISIHVNGVDNSSQVNGVEIYVRNEVKTGETRDYYHNYCTEERNELAEALRRAMDENCPLYSEKEARIKEQDLFVLREANLPSVLIETGYSTNEHDRLRLLNPQTKYKMAYSIYKGIEYFYNN